VPIVVNPASNQSPESMGPIKKAHDLQPQLELGFVPEAIIDYRIGLGVERITLGRISRQLHSANIQRLSLVSEVLRRHLIAIRDNKKTRKRNTLTKIVIALRRIEAGKQAKQPETERLLASARTERDRIGLRKLARFLKTDHSTVIQGLIETRSASVVLQCQFESAFLYSDVN
jgi:hypothetical protein